MQQETDRTDDLERRHDRQRPAEDREAIERFNARARINQSFSTPSSSYAG
ncbi:MAG: hypothetical protein ACXVQ1_10150 [Actinomycetota bacterium]